MAERFAVDGWAVAGCGRTEQAIAEMQETLPDPHVFVLRCCRSFCRGGLLREGARDRRRPDLSADNAAIINANAPLWEVTEEEFARVIDINIKGVHAVIRQFLPPMIKRGSGVIVNFSSGWGRFTSLDERPYCATKWAIEGLTQALSQELPRDLPQ